MTDKQILKELQSVLKWNTDPKFKTVNYDGFAADVISFMSKLKKKIKEDAKL